METTYEEADVILPQQMMCAAATNQCITALSADSDMFVLMAYHYMMKALSCKALMEGTSANKPSINMGATVKKHKNLCHIFWG